MRMLRIIEIRSYFYKSFSYWLRPVSHGISIMDSSWFFFLVTRSFPWLHVIYLFSMLVLLWHPPRIYIILVSGGVAIYVSGDRSDKGCPVYFVALDCIYIYMLFPWYCLMHVPQHTQYNYSDVAWSSWRLKSLALDISINSLLKLITKPRVKLRITGFPFPPP